MNTDQVVADKIKGYVEAFDQWVFPQKTVPIILENDKAKAPSGVHFHFSKTWDEKKIGMNPPEEQKMMSYVIFVSGIAAHVKELQNEHRELGQLEKSNIPYSDDQVAVGIAASLVRYRIQREEKKLLFTPWGIRQIPELRGFAYFYLTTRNMYANDLRLNVTQFDALVVERFVIHDMHQKKRLDPQHIANILRCTPNTIKVAQKKKR